MDTGKLNVGGNREIFCRPLILLYWTLLIILTCSAPGSSTVTALATALNFYLTDFTCTYCALLVTNFSFLIGFFFVIRFWVAPRMGFFSRLRNPIRPFHLLPLLNFIFV